MSTAPQNKPSTPASDPANAPRIIRLWPAVIFIALIFLAKEFIIKPVAYAGFIPWLFMMVWMFCVAIGMENKDRKRDRRPAYSWGEARELVAPLCVLAAVIALAYSYSTVVGH